MTEKKKQKKNITAAHKPAKSGLQTHKILENKLSQKYILL